MPGPWACPTPDGRPPHLQPELIVVAQTVLGEAEGEPVEGKVAVAWVIRNRVDSPQFPDTSAKVCLQPMQFSCWNSGSPRLRVMSNPKAYVSEESWTECFLAAMEAMFRLKGDPTGGANHYLNLDVTRRINHGKLPGWYKESAVTAQIGPHTFLRL